MIGGKDGLVLYFRARVGVLIEPFIYNFPPLDNYSVTFVGFIALGVRFSLRMFHDAICLLKYSRYS